MKNEYIKNLFNIILNRRFRIKNILSSGQFGNKCEGMFLVLHTTFKQRRKYEVSK